MLEMTDQAMPSPHREPLLNFIRHDRFTLPPVTMNELMEENVLNFNAPLLSTRRSSLSAGVSNREKGKALPQEWIPKKTKDRISRISECKSADEIEPVAAAFAWDYSPGKINDRNMQQLDTIRSKPPPGGDDADIAQRFVDKNIEGVRAFKLSNGEYSLEEGFSDSDSIDEHSCAESYGRVSDFSGPDTPIETSSTDSQISDFMMSRFLPAAKAMTIDLPSTKQHDFFEPRRHYGKGFSEERPALIRYPSYPNPLNLYEGYMDGGDSGESDVDVENMPSITCGLIPKFNRIRYLCLLNTIPGVSPKTTHCNSGKHGRNEASESSYSNSNKTGGEKLDLENEASESSYSSHCSSSTGYTDIIKACRLTPSRCNRPPFHSPETEKTDSSSSLAYEVITATPSSSPFNSRTGRYDCRICPPNRPQSPSLPPPPPLPKSPSDSWLSQTLPRRTEPHFNLFKSPQKPYPGGNRHQPATKWETIVKTSHIQ